MADFDLEITEGPQWTLEVTPVESFDAEIFAQDPVVLEVNNSDNVSLEISSSPLIVIDVGVGYVHSQTASSQTWTVNHNLGYIPNVSILSPGNVLVMAAITHTNINQFTVSFNGPQTGTAVAR